MAQGIHLDPKKTPANTGFPPTVDELLRFIAEFMEVKGLNNILGIQVQEAKPSNTTLPWLSTNSVGKPLGMFKFFNSIWTSTEHEKGDYKYQNLTGSLHPHWRFADNSINVGPINGVTIPTVTNRGLKAAAPGGKYSVGETGGADVLNHTIAQMPNHGHGVGGFLIQVASVADHTHDVYPPGKTNVWVHWSYDSGSPDGGTVEPAWPGGAGGNTSVLNAQPAGGHTHTATLAGTSATVGSGADIDNRSLYFGARLLIYVGVE